MSDNSFDLEPNDSLENIRANHATLFELMECSFAFHGVGGASAAVLGGLEGRYPAAEVLERIAPFLTEPPPTDTDFEQHFGKDGLAAMRECFMAAEPHLRKLANGEGEADNE